VGLAIAPAGFGDVAGDLLLVTANFGDGKITRYNLTTGLLVETLQDAAGPSDHDRWFVGAAAIRQWQADRTRRPLSFHCRATNGEADGCLANLRHGSGVLETWGFLGIGLAGFVVWKRLGGGAAVEYAVL